MNEIAIANIIFGALTVIGQVLIILLAIETFVHHQNVRALLGKHGMALGFLVVLGATLGSLFYSQIAHYPPCPFCWWQRIFMFPQVIILGMGLWYKERNVVKYCLALSGIGIAIALYQYLLELGLVPSALCPAAGTAVSCSQRFVLAFDYISIPMMSLTAFLLSALFLAKARRSEGR